MNKNVRKRLIDLGAEKLADALIDLADQSEEAERRVGRMTAPPRQIVKKFKAGVAGLKRRKAFVPWRESAAFARKLESMLEDLEAGVDEPKTGAELVVRFYETDRGTLGTCDDSSGHIGDVYRFDARNLFVRYASRCEEKEWLADLVLRLNEEDPFGIRDSLIHCAAEYLPEEPIRSMIGRLWEKSEGEPDEMESRHSIHLVESLARQVKDAPLFEKARRSAWPELSTAACVDIATVYFESGNAFTALSWLDRIPGTESYMGDQRDKLLLAIHEEMGNREQLAKTAWRIFRRYRRGKTLQTLLDTIGEERRDEVVQSETARILRSEELSYSDAAFLIEVERWDDAESYILARADQLNGEFYTTLLPLARSLESEGRLLAASVLYRALLESILARGISKYYGHGVRYLKKLDALAGKIDRWAGFVSHADYAEGIRKNHGRKISFWSRYEK